MWLNLTPLRPPATGCPIEPPPALPCGIDQLEDESQRRLIRQGIPGTYRAMAHGGKGVLNPGRRMQVPPVLGRNVAEGQQSFAVLDQASYGIFCSFEFV